MKKLLLLAMTMLMAVMLVAGCGSDGPKKMVVGLDDNFRRWASATRKMKLSATISTWHVKPANAQGWKLI